MTGPATPGTRTWLRPTHAIGLVFVANGLAMPALLPRLPQVKDAVGADEATFGLALLGTGVGGLIGSALAPRVARHLGSRTTAVVSAVVLALVTLTVGMAGSVPVLFVAFALMGVSDGIADITQNHLMFQVQRTATRSLTSRMHALWSVGALVGTAAGTVAAAADVGVLPQTAIIAAVAVTVVTTAGFGLRGLPDAPPLEEDASEAASPPGRRTRTRRWARVVLAALAVAAVEGVANEWSALTLRDGLGATAALAGAGPTAFAGAMLVGRLVGDRGIDRWGLAGAVRAGGMAVAVGAGAGLLGAVLLDQPVALVLGLVVAGVGAATLFPSMLAAGDRLEATGTGVAVASSAARAGFLVVPVVVGLLGQTAGLPVGFALMPVAGAVVVAVLPPALRGRAR